MHELVFQVVKLHTKLGKPIPSTEPSLSTQTLSSSTAAPSKTSAATLSSSSTTSCLSATSSAATSTPYLKPVNIVSSGTAAFKNQVGLSAASSTSAAKKVGTPKINFVGE